MLQGPSSKLVASSPSLAPSQTPSNAPTQPLGSDYELVWSGGTNNVVAGVEYTFHSLFNVSHAYLKVDVFPTNFGDPTTEYVSNITANGIQLSSFCSPHANNGTDFYTCFRDYDVLHLINASTGSLDVRVRASPGVDAYAHDGYLLYVQFTLSGYVFPTGQPTSIPSSYPSSLPTGQPTSLPTATPTSRPSMHPSGSPTSQPTSQPSGSPSGRPSASPSGQPTGLPTAMPTSSSPTFAPTLPPSIPHVWMGGSGYFDAAEKWNHLTVPGSADEVNIFLSSNETIYIPPQSFYLGSLNLSGDGWVIYAALNSTLMVEGQLTYSGGYIKGYSEKSVLSATNCTLIGASKKILQTISLKVLSTFLWLEGDLLLGNATLDSENVAYFDGFSSELQAGEAPSFYAYDSYVGETLNSAVDFRLLFPQGNAVYDLVVGNVVMVSESTLSLDSWPLEVQSDSEAAIYYAYYVGYGEESLSLYNRSISNIDVDSCAEICSAYSWCQSFDYYRAISTCLLSAFSKGDVGGLINSTDENPTHFEKRSAKKSLSSMLLFRNTAFVDQPGLLSEVPFFTASGSSITIMNRASLVLTSGGYIATGSGLNIECATLAILGSSISILDTDLVNASCSGNSTIYLNGGAHYFDGNTFSIPNLLVDNASLTFLSNITFYAWNMSIINSATFGFEGTTSLLNTSSLSLVLGAGIVARNISIIANSVYIDEFSYVSVAGGGEIPGMGVGAGIYDPIAASGGSYGGEAYVMICVCDVL